MRGLSILVVALLTGACSLLSDVSDLSFDDDVDTETGPDGDADADADADTDSDTDTDSDSDTDADTDSDTDTWPLGTCENPCDMLGDPPTSYSASTVDQPDTFVGICGSECCDGGDFVFVFTAPQAATYEVTVTNDGISGPVALSMLELCEDDTACIADTSGANGYGTSISLTRQLEEWQTVYLVVQGMIGDGDFTLAIDLVLDLGAGSCTDPFVVSIDTGPWTHADTTTGKVSLISDYSTCDTASPVSEQFPGPESYYRLETQTPEQYVIEAMFLDGTSGVLALMSDCGDVSTCFASAAMLDSMANLLLDADTGGVYHIIVDSNPPGAYTLTVTPCALAPCSGSVVDGCCPFECGVELDQDCCNLAGCGDMGSDNCCPAGCTSSNDNDCPP